MPAEYFPEETEQPRQQLGAENDVFARIGRLAHELGVTSAGAYFSKNLPDRGSSIKMLAVSQEAGNMLFFAYNQTDPLVYNFGSRGRKMDAFLVNLKRGELAYLKPAVMFYSQQSNRWMGQHQAGPLILDGDGVVGISDWSTPQLTLRPTVSSPQPERLVYERTPDVSWASLLASRLSSFAPQDRQERIMFPVGV